MYNLAQLVEKYNLHMLYKDIQFQCGIFQYIDQQISQLIGDFHLK